MLLAAGHQRILSILYCRWPVPSLLFGPPRRHLHGHHGVIVIVDAAPALMATNSAGAI